MDQQTSSTPGRTRTTSLSERLALPTLAVLALCCSPATVSSFSPAATSRLGGGVATLPTAMVLAASSSSSSNDIESQVDRQLELAKALLVKSKAKLAKRENGDSGSNGADNGKDMDLPFFASTTSNRSRDIIKSKNEETGLVTADGEKMAALSEEEEWESRSLLEVFENEIDENEDVYSLASQQLASRDVAASIWNLRKILQGEDYHTIFDKKNIFIQEE